MSNAAGGGHQPGAVATNLPHHLTSFIGRAAELRSLRSLLSEARLITIMGTGGAGKSRLASELAKATLDLWPDGVWWIELAAADDVAGAIVATLELPGRGPAEAVATSWLATRRALLILDNCEQLVGPCAAFSQVALARCPHLAIVATSREALGVPGEVRWPLSPLRDEDVLSLFEARARLVSPTFKMANSDVDAVTKICERLDRLPLAIEMAAPRLDLMSERELLMNLTNRFRLLTSGTRKGPERQQTMAATIDWSHRLLTEDEVKLFRRLSVFQGGFTLNDAQAICTDGVEANLIDLLGGLVQKSMLVAERLDDGSTRFRLLELHHAYARERLVEAGELEVLNRRHYEYFMACLGSRVVSWTGPQPEGPAPGIAGQRWKARESANLWAALGWARDNTEDMGLSLAVEIADFEFSDHARATALLRDLLPRSTAEGAVRAKAFNIAARLVSRQGDYETSRTFADTSVALARKVSDPELMAYVLNGAAFVSYARGDVEAATRMSTEALALLDGSRNQRLAIEIKNSLGLLAIERGDYSTAREILTECVAHSRSERDEPTMARHLESLGNALLGLGDIERAAAAWTESLSVFRDLNDPFGMIWCLGGLALVAAARKDSERTLRLSAAADRMSREWSLSTGSVRLNQVAEACRQSRAVLGDRKAEGAWTEGQAISTARAVDYALGGDTTSVALADTSPLSRREREVAAMVAAGMTNRQIAERLFIAERTAEGHVERIRNKLGFRSRTEVATWAVERGLGPRKLDNPPPSSTV